MRSELYAFEILCSHDDVITMIIHTSNVVVLLCDIMRFPRIRLPLREAVER